MSAESGVRLEFEVSLRAQRIGELGRERCLFVDLGGIEAAVEEVAEYGDGRVPFLRSTGSC